MSVTSLTSPLVVIIPRAGNLRRRRKKGTGAEGATAKMNRSRGTFFPSYDGLHPTNARALLMFNVPLPRIQRTGDPAKHQACSPGHPPSQPRSTR